MITKSDVGATSFWEGSRKKKLVSINIFGPFRNAPFMISNDFCLIACFDQTLTLFHVYYSHFYQLRRFNRCYTPLKPTLKL